MSDTGIFLLNSLVAEFDRIASDLIERKEPIVMLRSIFIMTNRLCINSFEEVYEAVYIAIEINLIDHICLSEMQN